MAVDLRIMRYVIAIAEEGGFQRAADRLHMAQPPLSRQIRDLERQLGVALFHRRPQVGLTEAGEVFVASAREVLAAADRLVQDTVRAGTGSLGTVRVGYVASAAYDTLPQLIRAAAQRHPGLVVDAQEGWTPALDAALLAGEVDAVLSRSLPDRPEFARVILRRERLVAVVDTGHPLARRTSVDLREFAGQTFCVFARRHAPAYHDRLLAVLEATGETFEHWENPVPGIRYLNLSEGARFALLPDGMTAQLPTTTTAIRLDGDPAALDLSLVWRSGRPTAAVEALVATAEELAEAQGWRD